MVDQGRKIVFEVHRVDSLKMISDGYLVGDGSWTLRVYVTDLQVERTIRVKGDLHMGGVMLKLVEDLGTNCKKIQTFPFFFILSNSLPVSYIP